MLRLIGFWGALCCVWLAGCDRDTNIIGTCELRSDAVRLVANEDRPTPPARPSVGRIDQHTLLSWYEFRSDGERPYIEEYARWFGTDLSPSSSRIRLGVEHGSFRSQWVVSGDALHAQVWADPTEEVPTGDDDDVFRWRLTPPPEAAADRSRVESGAKEERCSGPALGLPSRGAGPPAVLPSLANDEDVWSAFGGIPPTCSECWTDYQRLFMFRHSTRAANVRQLSEPLCGDPHTKRAISNPVLVPFADSAMAALFRLGNTAVDGRMHMVVLDDRGTPQSSPILVGGPQPASTVDSGNQPRAVRMGERILFTERRASKNSCRTLRLVKTDGSGAHDAPWQLPCKRHPEQWRTGSVELLRVPGGAVLVWSERTNVEDTGWVTSEVDNYQERIRVVLLTPSGKRGSPILTVTDPAATRLRDVPRTPYDGPVPSDFLVGAAVNDAGELTVAWTDRRTGAPGIYARRLRCRVNE